MFVLKPTLTEEERGIKYEFIKNIITSHGGEIVLEKANESKELAYKIDIYKRGYFSTLYFKVEPSVIMELERNFRIMEDVIRFIIVKYDTNKEVRNWTKLVENTKR
jgi:small subunit ribosomal protein S6